MVFTYTGFESLLDPEVFIGVYANAVEETALAFNFSVATEYGSIDNAYDFFSYHYRRLAWSETKPRKFRVLVPALSIYAASLYRPYDPAKIIFPGKVVGLQSAMARRNPNELIALTFGLGVFRMHEACMNSTARIVHNPRQGLITRVSQPKLRTAIQTIAENRNKDIQAKNGQFTRSFHTLMNMTRLVVTEV